MLSGPIPLLCEQGYPEARFNHVPFEKFWLGFLSSRTQRTQYPFLKESALKYWGLNIMIYGIFLK